MTTVSLRTPLAATWPKAFASAIIFWVFTYLLFSYRSHLRYGNEAVFADPERFISTGVGALLLWMVLSLAIPARGSAPTRPVLVMASVIPASLLVLGTRTLFDFLAPDHLVNPASNFRFVTVWAAYFGLWVSATLVLRYADLCLQHRRDASPLVQSPTASAPTIAVPVPAGPPSHEHVESWTEVTTWLAEEMQALPDGQRAQLADRLLRRAGYECADPINARENERIDIVRRLAATIAP